MGNKRAASGVRNPRAKVDDVVDVVPVASADPATVDDEPLDLAFDRLRAEVGDGVEASVNVYRIGPDKRRTFVDAYPLGDVESEVSFLARLRDDWGGGEFRLMAHNGRGFSFNRLVRIEARPTRRQPDEPPQASPIVQLIEQQNARFDALLARLAPTQSPAEVEAATLERLKVMRDLFAPAEPRRGGGVEGEALKLFMQGVEFARKAAPVDGDVGGAAVLVEGIRQFGPVIARAVAGATGQPARAAARSPALAQPAPAAAPSTSAAGVPADVAVAAVPGDNERMRAALVLLVAAAQGDADVDLYAELIVDQVGDDAVRQVLAQPEPQAVLLQLAPALANFAAWTADLVNALRAVIADAGTGDGAAVDAAAPANSGRDAGDVANAGADGGGDPTRH